jgi:PAS domain S-box-containing protein
MLIHAKSIRQRLIIIQNKAEGIVRNKLSRYCKAIGRHLMDRKQSKLAQLRERATVVVETTNHDSHFSDLDRDILIEELRVHQIELDIQLDDIHQAYAVLHSAQQRYTELFDSAPINYFVIDGNGEIKNVNIAASQMIGIERENLIGRAFTEFVSADFQDRFYFCWRALQNERKVQTCELELQHKNGRRIPTLLNTNLAKEASKEILLAITDLSPLKHANESLVLDSELTKDVNQVRLSILSTVAPEFHSPFAVILSSVELLYKHGMRLTDRKKDQLFQSIRNLVWYMNDALQDARNVKELDKHEAKQLKAFELLSFTQQVINDIELIVDKCQIVLDIKSEQEGIYVFWNINVYRRILMNLICSLLSFSSKSIRCSLEAHESYFLLRVASSTTSLRKTELAELFEALNEGKNTRFIQGRGNGLYLVYLSVQSLGARIIQEYSEGGGLSFVIELPRLQTSPSSYRQ